MYFHSVRDIFCIFDMYFIQLFTLLFFHQALKLKEKSIIDRNVNAKDICYNLDDFCIIYCRHFHELSGIDPIIITLY